MMVTVATEGKAACVVIASALRQEGVGGLGEYRKHQNVS